VRNGVYITEKGGKKRKWRVEGKEGNGTGKKVLSELENCEVA
jgi:hypothetical protein